MADWKRPKILDSLTQEIHTPAGTLFLTLCYDDRRLIELHGIIGKQGTYASLQLDIICRLISIILQTRLSRAKIMRKIKNNFYTIKWELPFEFEKKKYSGYEDYLFKLIVNEIRAKKLYKKYLSEKK